MFGLAASMAVIVSLVILAITAIQNKIYKGVEDD
jgi:ABC-type sugar transport system permease subunit